MGGGVPPRPPTCRARAGADAGARTAGRSARRNGRSRGPFVRAHEAVLGQIAGVVRSPVGRQAPCDRRRQDTLMDEKQANARYLQALREHWIFVPVAVAVALAVAGALAYAQLADRRYEASADVLVSQSLPTHAVGVTRPTRERLRPQRRNGRSADEASAGGGTSPQHHAGLGAFGQSGVRNEAATQGFSRMRRRATRGSGAIHSASPGFGLPSEQRK